MEQKPFYSDLLMKDGKNIFSNEQVECLRKSKNTKKNFVPQPNAQEMGLSMDAEVRLILTTLP